MTGEVKDGVLTFRDETRNPSVTISVDLNWISGQLDEESMMALAEVVTWDCVLRVACKRLAGEDYNYWSSMDKDESVEFLSRVEDHCLSGYKWSLLSSGLHDLGRYVAHHEKLYWTLYHDPAHGDWFRKWAQERGLDGEFHTELPNFEAFEKRVGELLHRFAGHAIEAGTKQEADR